MATGLMCLLIIPWLTTEPLSGCYALTTEKGTGVASIYKFGDGYFLSRTVYELRDDGGFSGEHTLGRGMLRGNILSVSWRDGRVSQYEWKAWVLSGEVLEFAGKESSAECLRYLSPFGSFK